MKMTCARRMTMVAMKGNKEFFAGIDTLEAIPATI